MLSCLLNKQESKVIELSEQHNEDELLGWQIPNIFFPLIVIGVSLLAYGFLTPKGKFEWLSLFNLLVNGSILMTSFNRMSSMISYFSKIEFIESKKRLGINLRNVKMKILAYSLFLVLIITVLYSYQVIYKPFTESCIILTQLILSGLLFWCSIDATKVAFLLQDAFLNNTYELSFKAEMQSVSQTPPPDDIKF